MRNEVRLEHIQEEHEARVRALQHFQSMEKSQRHQEYLSIKTDLSPRTFESKLDWLHGRTCEGTSKWLMRDPAFIQWLNISDTKTNVFVVSGYTRSRYDLTM